MEQSNIEESSDTELLYKDKKDIWNLLHGFMAIYDREEKELPYHINFIDELHANENAHSRLLGKLLQQQEPANKRFEILENFLKFIIEKYPEKSDFHKIKVKNPLVTIEKERIDLWIRDKDEYAIIFENKIGWACDQTKQLEGYIEKTRKQNYNEENIYVLYLPPTYEKEPDKQTWGDYFNSDIRKRRYLDKTEHTIPA